MKKDTFYFSHDYNANNDVKILFLRQQLGMEGYGIYWFLIESLADAGGMLPLKLVPVLAMQMYTSEVKVDAVINQFELFQVVDSDFYSERLLNHLEVRKSLSDAGKLGAIKRWNGVANGVANGEGNAKERKGKEIKGKESKVVTNGKKFLNTDFEILPEQYIISSIQQIKLQKQQTITADVINQMWDVFKLQNLTGDKFYNNENEVYKHFGNWIKNQKFEKNGTKPTNEARWDARVEWANQFNSKGTSVNKD